MTLWYSNSDGTRVGDDFVSLFLDGSVDLNLDFHNGDGEIATQQKVNWSSADSNVATVDDSGVVRAQATGTTIINVQTADGKLKLAQTVNVFRKLTELRYDQKKINIPVGGSASPPGFATTPADAAIVWVSQRPDLAQVQADGSIKALAKGEVTFTVVYGYSFTDYKRQGIPGVYKPLAEFSISVY
jgi:hypothetical protein